MLIQYFPDFTIAEKGSGPIRHFFKDLQGEKPPFLWTMVRETLEKVRKSSTLEDLERQGWVARLPGVAEPIYVFKIPPKGRKAGVTRIYFAFKKMISIQLFCCPLKKNME